MGISSIKRAFGVVAILGGFEPFKIVSYQTSHSFMMLSVLKHVSTTGKTVMTILM